jgi:PAS domain S-box-containing protein
MATRPETGRSPSIRTQAAPTSFASATVPPPSLSRNGSRAWPFAIGLVFVLVTQPIVSGFHYAPLWLPAGGISFALVAWFGRRAALLPLLAGILAAAGAALAGGSRWSIVGAASDGGAAALEAVAGCWLFLRIARGGRRLSDPRSALEFLLLVPGCAAVLGSAARAAVTLGSDSPLTLTDFISLWLAHALGLSAVAPPLLVGLTPWLIRRGYTPEDAPDAAPPLPGPVGADRVTAGDIVEIAGLALGAGGLGLLLALSPGHRVLAGWQTWSAPLLLIVWASLRQGLLGGASVAAAAVAVPLAVMANTGTAGSLALLLQGNLLAQASTGLLVAASASWLRSSERRYRQLVAHVPVVVYSVRLAGNPLAAEVTLVSAASAALLGCPPDQFLGDHDRWLEHIHPEDRELLRAAITQLTRQPEPVTCEYRLAPTIPCDWKAVDEASLPRVRTGGTPNPPFPAGVRWVRDTLAPQRDVEGHLTGWEGVLTDITEERILADDLRRTSSMLHALVNNLPAGVFFVQGPQGRPILVNARARQLLGQHEYATLAHIASAYRLHRADASAYPVDELPVARALREGRTTMCDDIVVHRPDGRRVPLVTWAAPVQLSGTAPDAAVWVLEDLTALHQAEAARRETEGRLRAVVETMGEALVVFDRKGDVVDANPAAARLFGGDPATLRGQSIAELGWNYLQENGEPLPDDDHPAWITLRTGRPVRGAVIGLRCKSGPGTVRWVLINAMPLGSPPEGVVTTLSDVTKYQQTRDGIRASEERYRGVIDTLPLPVVQTDCSLRPTYWNAALLSATGYSMEEIAAPDVLAGKVHPKDLSELCAVAGFALAGHSGRGECRFRMKDGSEIKVRLFVEPRREQDRIAGITVVVVSLAHESDVPPRLDSSHATRAIPQAIPCGPMN